MAALRSRRRFASARSRVGPRRLVPRAASSRSGALDRPGSARRRMPPLSCAGRPAAARERPVGGPASAVSVAMLPFRDGKELRVGDTVAVGRDHARPRRRGRPPGSRSRRLGERLTRFYEYSGARFILVFEPFERQWRGAESAAIYLP